MLDTTEYSKPRWTDQQVEELKACWQTASMDELCRRFNRTPYAVQCKAQALQLPYRPRMDSWPQKQVDQLEALWADGHSASQIGLLMGLTRNAVLGKVHRLGFNEKYPHRPCVGNGTRVFYSRDERISLKSVKRSPQPRPLMEFPFGVGLESCPASILELNDITCRWPMGEPRDRDFHFCGGFTGGRTYCACHHKLAYQPRGGAQTPKAEQQAVSRKGGGFVLRDLSAA